MIDRSTACVMTAIRECIDDMNWLHPAFLLHYDIERGFLTDQYVNLHHVMQTVPQLFTFLRYSTTNLRENPVYIETRITLMNGTKRTVFIHKHTKCIVMVRTAPNQSHCECISFQALTMLPDTVLGFWFHRSGIYSMGRPLKPNSLFNL